MHEPIESVCNLRRGSKAQALKLVLQMLTCHSIHAASPWKRTPRLDSHPSRYPTEPLRSPFSALESARWSSPRNRRSPIHECHLWLVLWRWFGLCPRRENVALAMGISPRSRAQGAQVYVEHGSVATHICFKGGGLVSYMDPGRAVQWPRLTYALDALDWSSGYLPLMLGRLLESAFLHWMSTVIRLYQCVCHSTTILFRHGARWRPVG